MVSVEECSGKEAAHAEALRNSTEVSLGASEEGREGEDRSHQVGPCKRFEDWLLTG